MNVKSHALYKFKCLEFLAIFEVVRIEVVINRLPKVRED